MKHLQKILDIIYLNEYNKIILKEEQCHEISRKSKKASDARIKGGKYIKAEPTAHEGA